MSLVFRLEDYASYLSHVGGAAYIDVTRRTDPARVDRVWANLYAVVRAYGAPWIAQIWTKDAAGVLLRGGSVLRCLRRYGTTLAAQVTVTGLSRSLWEPRTPAEPFVGVTELMALMGGPDHVTWRYDPIIPTVHRLGRFRRLAKQAVSRGISRCVINFLAPPGRYKRVDRRLVACQALPGWSEGLSGYDDDWRAEVADQLVRVGEDLGLKVAACAESAGLSEQVPGLGQAACGDHAWFVALSGRDPGRVPTSGSRPGCGCAAYFDVGLYGQRKRCHQCLYCYAG